MSEEETLTHTSPSAKPEEMAEQFLKVLDKLANARSARDGSLVGARPFSAEQLAIETNFRALLTGLGRARKEHALNFMRDPVLSDGKLKLGEALPADVSRIDAVPRNERDKRWWVEYAHAKVSADGLVIEHFAFTSDPLPRWLVAVDLTGRAVRIGFPRA